MKRIAVKLGKLDTSAGTTIEGGCPEGEILLNGAMIGSWGPDSQDEAIGYGSEYRVYGYTAMIAREDEDVVLSVVRNGATLRSGVDGTLGRPYRLSGKLEHPGTTKARLKRLIEAALETPGRTK